MLPNTNRSSIPEALSESSWHPVPVEMGDHAAGRRIGSAHRPTVSIMSLHCRLLQRVDLRAGISLGYRVVRLLGSPAGRFSATRRPTGTLPAEPKLAGAKVVRVSWSLAMISATWLRQVSTG